ncbi:hypothetical protein N7495_004315 [Penicillium taxi]|uniref:uncharacterized protein n=1 Tax=Penicillium taxi TaxID=168475 RepID=UPI0025457052|nr:uncharacterized protein N7495_004315 [Penicillium taxi]KAJ5899571.1 hypothetical protein N7495_004315 [Penicillium taxi]
MNYIRIKFPNLPGRLKHPQYLKKRSYNTKISNRHSPSRHLPGQRPAFKLQTRPTPKPGPDKLLIAVKSVALNPADAYMRDQGLFIPMYPMVIGFDMAGLVREVGNNVPKSNTSSSDSMLYLFQTIVVDAIISAARADGLVIRHCFLAIEQLASCETVL